MKTTIVLDGWRIAFPVLATPKPASQENPKLQYSAAFLAPPDHPQIATINQIIDYVLETKWPGKGKSVRKAAESVGKICLKDGDTKDQYEGYPGNLFINARLDADKGKPKLYGLGGVRGGEVPASTIYAGCYVRAKVSFFAYGGMNNIPKGVGCGLGDIQFIRDGDAFSAAAPRASDDEFGAMEVEQEADPLCE